MSDQADLFGEHAVARRTDPDTSHEAARSVRHIRQSQQDILDVLQHGAMTDEEIFEALCEAGICISLSGARTRRSELVDMGRVIDTGHRLFTRSGRRTIVWAARKGD